MALIQSTAIPSGATDYELDQSLKLDSASVANLQFTPSSASNRKTWTLSFWCKVGDIASGEQSIFTAGTSCTDRLGVMLDGSNHLSFNVCGVGDVIETQAVYRDPSAWLHCVFVLDTTQSTSTDRGKIYVNGEAVALTHNSSLTLNKDYTINNNTLHAIGALSNAVTSASYTFGGYLGEMHFIDGQTLTPADFGKTGTYGEWKPIEYSGTYGTNGFYLSFAGGGVMSATGGNSTVTDGDYKAASFTSNGTFTPSADGYVEYLVIGGGGGTGATGAGGGGAGGYRTGYLPVTGGTAYSITVGAGGAAGGAGSNGGDSVFSSITSTGGGAGYGWQSAGNNGGSGGGAGARSNAAGGSGNTPSTSPSQGNDGGNAQHTGLGAGAGGGGAGGAGGDHRDAGGGSWINGGHGGAGLASSITGSSVTRAGGGGGGQDNGGEGGTGGSGGGGNGTNSSTVCTAGAANTGSGGGGGGNPGPSNEAGAAGGSGIVIIRYKFQ